MQTQTLKSNLLLLVTAAIWGFAFVAQRVGMEYLGPFTFNGVRFALGSLSLIPLILYHHTRTPVQDHTRSELPKVLGAGLIAGLCLFLGASLQQIGLVYTTAGKAAFITGLYIVIVPLLGIFLKQHITVSTWFGAFIAVVGLYLLCATDRFLAYGDLLEFIGAFFWAGHILLIDHFARKVDVLKLAFFQFITCSALSLTTALYLENITMYGLQQALLPLLYGGVCSVGVAYTLQVVAQKHANPAHAAIILSMETVFAAIGGLLILNEVLGIYGILGCTLMFIGMLLPQLQYLK